MRLANDSHASTTPSSYCVGAGAGRAAGGDEQARSERIERVGAGEQGRLRNQLLETKRAFASADVSAVCNVILLRIILIVIFFLQV